MDELRVVRSGGVAFGFREVGVAEGTPVFLLHGFPDAANGWDALIALLQPAKRKLRLIVPSQRGYGATEVLQGNLMTGQEAALAHDVLVLADALKMQRFAMVGHDWGARAGFDVCVLAPERVMGLLALSSPYAMYGGGDLPPEQVTAYWYQWFFQTAQGETMLRGSAKALCEHIWRVWSPGWRFRQRDFEATAKFWENPQFATVTLSSYRHRYGNELGKPAYQAMQDEVEARPKIAVPTVFGYGTEDHCVLPAASEGLGRFFSGWFERVALRGVGHFPHREDPKAVLRLFERWWGKVR